MTHIPMLRLPKEHAIEVCKMGEGAACCKYLAAGEHGLDCLKLQPGFRVQIDAKTDMVAQSDNCDGMEMVNG